MRLTGRGDGMKTRIKKGIAAATAVMAASTAIFLGNTVGAAAAAPSLPAFGLISNGATMCSFNTNAPGTLNWVRDVTGFVGDETRLIGIDARVQDGLLYGVGDKGFIYTITVNPDPTYSYVDLTKVSQLTVPLYGTTFGVDFNPAADRLRIISDNGQNLRHNLNDHTTVEDLSLNLNGAPGRGVTAAAYTNNDLSGDSATTLFDLDTVNDQVVIQAAPNNGTLNPTGKLGVDASLNAGADIFSDLPSPTGKTVTNTAFAAFVPTGVSRASFYMFDVLTGTATKVGDFPSIVPVTDVAVALDRN
jgi:hypothetical protein